MSQIFLSYSRNDQDVMSVVKGVLGETGATVWTDENLEVGTPMWERTVEEAISASSCLVALLSPAAKSSIWVRSEISRARRLQVHIVPVVVGGEQQSDFVPLSLETANWIDIRHSSMQGLAKLGDTISKIIGGGGRADVAIAEPHVSSAAEEGLIDDSYEWQAVGQVLHYYPAVHAAGIRRPREPGECLADRQPKRLDRQRSRTLTTEPELVSSHAGGLVHHELSVRAVSLWLPSRECWSGPEAIVSRLAADRLPMAPNCAMISAAKGR